MVIEYGNEFFNYDHSRNRYSHGFSEGRVLVDKPDGVDLTTWLTEMLKAAVEKQPADHLDDQTSST